MTARILCTFHCDHAGCERTTPGTLRLAIGLIGGEVYEQRTADNGEIWATPLHSSKHFCPDHKDDANPQPEEKK